MVRLSRCIRIVAFAGVKPLRDVPQIHRRVDNHLDGLAAVVRFGREEAVIGTIKIVGKLPFAAFQVIALLLAGAVNLVASVVLT